MHARSPLAAWRSPPHAGSFSTSTSSSRLWIRHQEWQRQRRSHHAAVTAAAAAAARRPPPPWQAPTAPPLRPFADRDDDDQEEQHKDQAKHAPPDSTNDSHRRHQLRELLGGLRDDVALNALDRRAPGVASYDPSALAATLDALGIVLGLERRHLVRVVALAPRLLTDPGRARRVVEALGEVLGSPQGGRPGDAAVYGRAFPPLLALAPDDDEEGEEAAAEENDDEGDDPGLNARVRALARMLVLPPAQGGAPQETAFRSWALEYPPRAAALLSQTPAEVRAKLARLESALAAGGGGQNNDADVARAARMLALARPLLLDVGQAVLRSRVLALAEAGGITPPQLAALALSAGGSGVDGSSSSDDALRQPAPSFPPRGVQGLGELLMCTPQRLTEWVDALAWLLLPRRQQQEEDEAAPPPKQRQPGNDDDALPLAAAASHPLGQPRAFVVEALLLVGARNPSDVVVRWRALQTALWRRRRLRSGSGGGVGGGEDWWQEVERRFSAADVAAALQATHEQMARVAFLASPEGAEAGGADVTLREALRGDLRTFDRRYPTFRRWLHDDGGGGGGV